MSKFFTHWLPLIFWMILIFALSSLPTVKASHIDVLDFIVKKSAHIAEYAILFTLLFRAIKHENSLQTAFLIGLFYAFTDETHQLFTPGRGGSIRDVLLFDTFGLSIAWYFLYHHPKISKWIK